MKSEPIITFANDEQLQESLGEWQARLFLNNWTIRAKIAPFKDIDACGDCSANTVRMFAEIRISEHKKSWFEDVQKTVDELTLVHELLHLKIGKVLSFNAESLSYPAECFALEEHVLLEQMAKSLIMAKYNLPFEWFKNI